MRININTNEKFKKIEILRNDNSNHYQINVSGNDENGNEFSFNCNKCEDIELGFNILENGKMKVEGIKS